MSFIYYLLKILDCFWFLKKSFGFDIIFHIFIFLDNIFIAGVIIVSNNAELGITIQSLICKKFNVEIHPNAVKQFDSNFNPIFINDASDVIDRIFEELKLFPIKCLTYAPSENVKESLSPHNFILSDNSTLSIRTNIKGDKIAPRVVGQAGIDTFNEHFGSISGYPVSDKNEIKKIVFDNIHLMLPTFIDYLFLSDYTVWVQADSNKGFSFTIFDKRLVVDISFEREYFSFTRDLSAWTESTTLKYKGKSLAEIQIHKNRTFKFRFIMNALAALLVEERNTTETFGISAEKSICDIFNLPIPEEYRNRYSSIICHQIEPIIKNAFQFLPKAIKSTGAETGERGENSKCSYDFLLEGNKTLSLKTNTGKMICPPEVGQPGASTAYLYFKDYIDEEEMTNDAFKNMVFKYIDKIMPIYVYHLFDSDFLLWIFKRKDIYSYKIYDSNFARDVVWKKENFSFTKPTIDEWNESNTVKYCGISIGEFQIHKNRACYKFRFNMENFERLINERMF